MTSLLLPESHAFKYMSLGQLVAATRPAFQKLDDYRYDWPANARPDQIPPDSNWKTLLLRGGRGSGKTKTGSETIRQWAKEANGRPLIFAVIGRTYRELMETIFEGPSGFINILPPSEADIASFNTTRMTWTLKNGCKIRGFTAEKPDAVRGQAFEKVWFDEYGAYAPKDAKTMFREIWFCMRDSIKPQLLITTTGRNRPHMIDLHREAENPKKRIHIVTSRTRDNTRLPADTVADLEESYAGTRLGAQELDGVQLMDVEGALWRAEWFQYVWPREVPADEILRVLAVDPSVTNKETSDNTALAVVSLNRQPGQIKPTVYVHHIESFNLSTLTTTERIRKVYKEFKCSVVIVETNNGGEYVTDAIARLDPHMIVRAVSANDSKIDRARPVAMLYEQGDVYHVHPMDTDDNKWAQESALHEFETVATTFRGAPGEKSPDTLDAVVHGVRELKKLGVMNNPGQTASRPRRMIRA